MLLSGLRSRAVGSVVLLAGLVLAFLPAGGAPAAGPRDDAGLPDRMPGYSYLTGTVSASPPGRAIALFQFGFGVEFMDFPQAVVVGANGDVVRRLDVAEDRAGAETQGDPAPMLLSPDGTRAAVGDHDTSQPDVVVVDLTTGRSDGLPVPAGRSVLPVAWSADGERLAYLWRSDATNPHLGSPLTGDVGLLDLATGRTTELTDGAAVSSAAFSPDGSELAVQHAGGALEVLGADGRGLRTLRPPAGFVLDGPAAWSPDGALVATRSGPGGCVELPEDPSPGCTAPGVPLEPAVAFVDATGRGEPTPAPLDADLSDRRVLGWTGPDRVVVLVADPPGDYEPDAYRVVEVPLDGGRPTSLSSLPTGGGNYGVGDFHVATGLLPDLEVRPAGETDRGRWPLWLRLGSAVAAGVAAAGLVRRLGPWRRPAGG